MAGRNHSLVVEFVLIGFMDHLELQVPFFFLFLAIYLITLVGNLGMILLIRSDSQLRTPMYFFLINLSFVDVCYSSIITPKMLVNFLVKNKVISFVGCAVQFCFYTCFGRTECLLLAVMVYDCYMAICNSLIYTVIMSQRSCSWLMFAFYGSSFLNSVAQTISTFQLHFFGLNAIKNFFCDITPLLKLSCIPTQVNEIVIFAAACFLWICSCLTIVISSFYVLSSMMKIHSAEGRGKTFSTCASHLTAATIFYGALLFIYLRPVSSHFRDTAVIPMLNPFIYNVRNREVKAALRKATHKLSTFEKETLPETRSCGEKEKTDYSVYMGYNTADKRMMTTAEVTKYVCTAPTTIGSWSMIEV